MWVEDPRQAESCPWTQQCGALWPAKQRLPNGTEPPPPARLSTGDWFSDQQALACLVPATESPEVRFDLGPTSHPEATQKEAPPPAGDSRQALDCDRRVPPLWVTPGGTEEPAPPPHVSPSRQFRSELPLPPSAWVERERKECGGLVGLKLRKGPVNWPSNLPPTTMP